MKGILLSTVVVIVFRQGPRNANSCNCLGRQFFSGCHFFFRTVSTKSRSKGDRDEFVNVIFWVSIKSKPSHPKKNDATQNWKSQFCPWTFCWQPSCNHGQRDPVSFLLPGSAPENLAFQKEAGSSSFAIICHGHALKFRGVFLFHSFGALATPIKHMILRSNQHTWKIPLTLHQQFLKESLSLWGFGEVVGYLPRGPSGQNHWMMFPKKNPGTLQQNWILCRAMKDGWWSIPSIIDVTNTNFVWIPVLHGEVLAVVWKG